jgi:hypothetical protein
MPAKISEEKIEFIKQKTLEGWFQPDIAKELGVSSNCVYRYVKELGLNPGNRFKRKKSLRDDVFNIIDTEEKAYWLGFIMADGGVCYTTKYYKETDKINRFYINLAIKDIDVLIKLKEFLKTDSEVITYTPKGTYSDSKMCKLIINSVKLCAGLRKYGIVPNKTGKEVMPTSDLVPKELMNHFIRGFFDGDGSIYRQYGIRDCINFTSNESMLNDLKHFLMNNEIVKSNCAVTRISKDRNAFVYHFSNKEDVNRFYNYIYDNATVFMGRKYNKFGNTLYK